MGRPRRPDVQWRHVMVATRHWCPQLAHDPSMHHHLAPMASPSRWRCGRGAHLIVLHSCMLRGPPNMFTLLGAATSRAATRDNARMRERRRCCGRRQLACNRHRAECGDEPTLWPAAGTTASNVSATAATTATTAGVSTAVAASATLASSTSSGTACWLHSDVRQRLLHSHQRPHVRHRRQCAIRQRGALHYQIRRQRHSLRQRLLDGELLRSHRGWW